VLTRSTESFKVLTECPLIVMLLFQLYPRYIQTTIPSLIPMMVQTLALRPPRAGSRHPLACADFMAAQVKTLSFLTYLLRAFADFMRPYQESIPKCVIQLLLMCPPESASIRKDILVATRHILATDFRVGFFSQIDVLLDEKVLIGHGSSTSARSSHETLRPLACSTLADLVHHVRGELGIKHLSRVVYIFSCNIHDASLPLAIQTTSVRLLLNLVENIFHKNDAEGRALLVRILHCLVCKFATLKVRIARQLEEAKPKSEKSETKKALKTTAAAPAAAAPAAA
jgi:transformation/transcription domain-associated protein